MKVKSMIKFIVVALLANLGHSLKAQVGIEKTSLRSSSSILEFNDVKEQGGVSKGIILPTIFAPSGIKQGALWVDRQSRKVMYQSANEKVALTEASDISYPLLSVEDKESGVIIHDGSLDNFTEDIAVLKLDSNSKALLLPHVNDVTKDISNPEQGTIAYDVKSKSLAVFNGSKWYFWN